MAVAIATGIVAVLLGACSGSSKPHARPPDSPIPAAQQIAATGIADTGPLPVSAATSIRDATPNGAPSNNVTATDRVPAPTGQPADPTNTPTRPDTGATPTTAPGESCQTNVAPASCSPPTTTAPANSGGNQPPDYYTSSPGDTCTATATGYGDLGAAGVDSNVCRYQASSAAGYQASGKWAMWIDRAGTTRYFSSAGDPACSPTGLIQPGDVITVQAGWGGPSAINAGPAYHC